MRFSLWLVHQYPPPPIPLIMPLSSWVNLLRFRLIVFTQKSSIGLSRLCPLGRRILDASFCWDLRELALARRTYWYVSTNVLPPLMISLLLNRVGGVIWTMSWCLMRCCAIFRECCRTVMAWPIWISWLAAYLPRGLSLWSYPVKCPAKTRKVRSRQWEIDRLRPLISTTLRHPRHSGHYPISPCWVHDFQQSLLSR